MLCNMANVCKSPHFQGLNEITKKDRYPLPLISDLLDSLNHAKIYSKIYLQHTYHLVQIAPGDKWKTTFCTRYVSYKWLVMPFGLTNTPTAFQCFVNTIFADMPDVCDIVYLDNILIYSKDMESLLGYKWTVMVCLLTYISIKCTTYSRVYYHSLSVACQTTEVTYSFSFSLLLG